MPGQRSIVACILLVHGCAKSPPPASRPNPQSPLPVPTHGIPAAGPAQSPSVPELPTPRGTSVTFTEGPAIRFVGGPPLRLKPIATETEILALSPDARSWVIAGDGNTAKLVSPTLPSGVSHPVGVPSAIFSDDGARVLIWSMHGLCAIDVVTGRKIVERDGAVCSARFAGTNVVFHSYSDDADARLTRLDLHTGKETTLGQPRAAQTCYASVDSRAWIIESYGARWFVDGGSGAARSLGKEAEDAALSRAGNRWCKGDASGLVCLRLPDNRSEHVWSRPTSDSIVFDTAGDHAFITYAADADEVRSAFAFVDFTALTVRPLKGVRTSSGSMFDLSPHGELLTIGSSSGLHVYDVPREQHRFAAHRPLYGNFSFPHHPRVVVAGTDEPMDLFLVDLR